MQFVREHKAVQIPEMQHGGPPNRSLYASDQSSYESITVHIATFVKPMEYFEIPPFRPRYLHSRYHRSGSNLRKRDITLR
jgi:hypothetical protein